MKKALTLCAAMVFLLCAWSMAAAEAESSVDSTDFDEAFSALLALKDPLDPKIREFSKDYHGETVDFIGSIDAIRSLMRAGQYDITIRAGSYKDGNGRNPGFLFDDVNTRELGFQEDAFRSNFSYATDVHVIAKIDGYDFSTHCIKLLPIRLEKYNPLLAGLEVSAYTELAKGSRGEEVVTLQRRLIELKYLNDTADGVYGSKTKKAVEKFQRKNNLMASGVADPATQALLFLEDAPENELSISCSRIAIGSYAKAVWYVDGQEFTLTGKKTKTIQTLWGTYRFDALGHYTEITN